MSTIQQGPLTSPGVGPQPLETTVKTLHTRTVVAFDGLPPKEWGSAVKDVLDKFKLPTGVYLNVAPDKGDGGVHVYYNGQSGSVLLHSDGITY